MAGGSGSQDAVTNVIIRLFSANDAAG